MCTRFTHVGVCSDNSATVRWQTRGASKRSAAANRLLRILAIRLRKNRASPLITRHIAGKRNALGDVPSRSYGWKASWHYENDDDFLTFFNSRFPLPKQNSWTGFRLNDEVVSKVMRKLLTQGSPMAEWRLLPTLGAKYGPNGWPTANLSECLRIWTAATFDELHVSQQYSQAAFEKANEERPSELVTFVPDSGAS